MITAARHTIAALAQPLTPTSGPPALWLVTGYLLLAAGLLAHATHTALTAPDPTHRNDAYRVLKLLTAWTGSGSLLLTTALHLSA
ncbi:hypothetical protein CLV40_10245 [Actinokineospora auranticolor]|uniref:Uncharacterized protein n=1 Tax=Actinokineospora auranticolor TaxID=155976 RepID=A0A2S6GY23_9PSEU|nr:hypothetical protein CLV40_10245 [Actinokineospora auranticolor]